MNSFWQNCRLHVHVIISLSNDPVIRLCSAGTADATVKPASHRRQVCETFLCDARRRDLSPPGVTKNRVTEMMTGSLAIFQLLIDQPGETL
jgi:hypothetical protein